MISRQKREVAEKLRHHIYTNYTEPLDITKMMDLVCYSDSYCRRVFREVYGMTMTRYLQEVRLEEAKCLLETTNYKCYRIVYEVGYVKTQEFMEMFKAKYGVTMRQYRVQKRWISQAQSTLASTA